MGILVNDIRLQAWAGADYEMEFKCRKKRLFEEDGFDERLYAECSFSLCGNCPADFQ